MNAFAIRPATIQDIPAIARIYADAVRFGTASFELTPPDGMEMQRRFDALVKTGFPYFVADEAGSVLGYAYVGYYRMRPAYRFTVEDSVYVSPEAQRSGVGRGLLDRLIAECEALGFRQMVAIIGDSGNTASIALHRAAGFRMVGAFTDAGYKFGRWLDSVMMQRALGPGATVPPSEPRPAVS